MSSRVVSTGSKARLFFATRPATCVTPAVHRLTFATAVSMNGGEPKVHQTPVKKEDPFFNVHSLPSVVYKQFPLPGNVGLSNLATDESKRPQVKIGMDQLKSALDNVNPTVHGCTKLMRKEFRPLFVDVDVVESPLSVVSFCLPTKADMKFWSQEGEEERSRLSSEFIATASDVVTWLQSCGYWADFIDPTSGKPYFSAHTNDVLPETDDRMAHLGFTIEDMVCCKVVKHKQFGTNFMVGTLFTNAPAESEPMRMLAMGFYGKPSEVEAVVR